MLEAAQKLPHGKAIGYNNISDKIFTKEFLQTLFINNNQKILENTQFPKTQEPINFNAVYPTMLNIISSNISSILNLWLLQEHIPDSHSTARLIFLYKKISTEQTHLTIDMLRPIAITSIFYKLLEKIV